MKLKPDYIFNNLESIPFELLHQHQLKCLLIDIDNTIASLDTSRINQAKLDWLSEANQAFLVILISNNHGKRIKKISSYLGYPTYTFALKPISRAYKQVKKKYNLSKKDIVVIGDQLFTDVLGGKLQNFLTIYVHPMTKKDSIFTFASRFFERILMKKHDL